MQKLPTPPSENSELDMRNLCIRYISEIERYTQCQDQKVFKLLKRVFEDLIPAIAETGPHFHITFEEINKGKQASIGKGNNANNAQPQISLERDRTSISLERATLPSTLPDLRTYYSYTTHANY